METKIVNSNKKFQNTDKNNENTECNAKDLICNAKETMSYANDNSTETMIKCSVCKKKVSLSDTIDTSIIRKKQGVKRKIERHVCPKCVKRWERLITLWEKKGWL